MDVKIHGQNVKITEQLTDFAQKKLEKLDRYLPNISEVRVDVSREGVKRGGHLTTAQITLRHQRGAILRAEERLTGDDGDVVKAAILKAGEKMLRQIERFKGKRRPARRSRDKFDRFIATTEELEAAEEIPEGEFVDGLGEYDDDLEILRRKELALSPMNEQEAIAQMELLGHAFFVYQNGDSGAINILYRRDSGGYGVIVPQASS